MVKELKVLPKETDWWKKDDAVIYQTRWPTNVRLAFPPTGKSSPKYLKKAGKKELLASWHWKERGEKKQRKSP